MQILDIKTNSQKKLAQSALESLKKGELVVLPSDTVYGLAVDATNTSAVAKLISFKSRIPGKAISVFVGDLRRAKKYVEIGKRQEKLLQTLLPGAYTVVLSSRGKVVRGLESEERTLGVRIPDFEFINTLVSTYGRPITATSANISGRSPHYSVSSLLHSLPQKKKDMISLVVDFGALERRKPSTVIDLVDKGIKVLRKGDVVPDGTNERFISNSVFETKRIAQELLKKYIGEAVKKPLVILLQGELGVGKTVFVKGIGKALGVDNIVSPTFVIYYEYGVRHKEVAKLVHVDLYRLESTDEFKHLGLEDMLMPKTIVCIEWGEKSAEIYPELKRKGKVIYIKMVRIDEKKREVVVMT
ncbi:MAG: L-threonylcarbamoyladenylate synthase [Candidatus Paceibacterota bacterium]